MVSWSSPSTKASAAASEEDTRPWRRTSPSRSPSPSRRQGTAQWRTVTTMPSRDRDDTPRTTPAPPRPPSASAAPRAMSVMVWGKMCNFLDTYPDAQWHPKAPRGSAGSSGPPPPPPQWAMNRPGDQWFLVTPQRDGYPRLSDPQWTQWMIHLGVATSVVKARSSRSVTRTADEQRTHERIQAQRRERPDYTAHCH